MQIPIIIQKAIYLQTTFFIALKNLKSNKELLILIQKDDRVAFFHIYERYYNRLYGFVLKYVKQKEDTEEIVQEVFVKIWESRSKIDAYSSFESFLFTVAYNATMNMLRKKANEKKYIEYIKSLQRTHDSPDLIDEIHFNELNSKVQSLLNELTPRQKEIFQLSREQGLSHDEIAIKLNISVNTVKKHIANTLAFLKSKIDNGQAISLLFVFLFLN
ncbi:RNA polymerase sigma factor [Sunxiuqinia indica]|uniref:RNA polymerase sigma factor n=1 Tax=Sunxiuqinia indica TaxID=2692584 RepID=UPI0013584AD9|nr:RNA polymerase sigma-70 factor [Sunxiuqinia indica]